MKKLLLTITLCLIPAYIYAESTSEHPKEKIFSLKDLYVGAGTLTQFTGRIQQDESASTNSFDFNPYLTIGGEVFIYGDFSFAPEFAFTFPKDGRDPYMKKWTYWTQFLGVYTFQDFKFKLGPGLLMNRITSEGGTQSIRNGTGITDFPMPEGSSTSRNLTINFATQWQFIKEASARFEGQIINLTDSESRAFSYTFSLYYHFGNKLW